MKLAIKGHHKRGKEVIEILEMLGGINKLDLKGTQIDSYYYIDNIDSKIHLGLSIYPYEYIIYTLEEFLEKFPYKVGDKVWLHYKNLTIKITETITSMRWCSKDDCVLYDVCTWCNLKECAFIPYKEETIKEDIEQIKIYIPEGYEFFGIDDNDKVVFTKIQPTYPKDFDECAKIMKVQFDWHLNKTFSSSYETKLDYKIHRLKMLLICRDAYWKITGEQMGLGKDWEPDFESDIYYIYYDTHKRIFSKDYCAYGINVNHLLVFPTEEMRDAFYENFKELIEQCKELL